MQTLQDVVKVTRRKFLQVMIMYASIFLKGTEITARQTTKAIHVHLYLEATIKTSYDLV